MILVGFVLPSNCYSILVMIVNQGMECSSRFTPRMASLSIGKSTMHGVDWLSLQINIAAAILVRVKVCAHD